MTAGLESRVERYTPDGQPPVELRFFLKPGAGEQAQRMVDTTIAALRLLGDWFGPYPFPHLTVIDAPWRSPLAGAAYPGIAITSTRWIAPVTDVALERALIGAIARQYWLAVTPEDAPHRWLEEGLVLYSGTRAIHEGLAGRNFATHRFFGGFIPFTTRSLSWSPNPADPRPRLRHFSELEEPANAPWRAWTTAPGSEAQRAALAIHTLERYAGWPALQQALFAVRERGRTNAMTLADLSEIASEQRGRDLSWFFTEAFRFDARFDYAIVGFASDSMPDEPSRFATKVELRRLGDAVFAGTNEARVAPFETARSLPVTVAFEDGTSVSDWWDGRDAGHRFHYVSRSRAVRASVDPDAVLLLDADRGNNTRTLHPGIDPIGAMLGFHWLVWLQDLMLTYTAIA